MDRLNDLNVGGLQAKECRRVWMGKWWKQCGFDYNSK